MGAKSDIEWTDATWSPLRVRVRKDAALIAATKGYASLIQIGEKMAGRVGQHCEHVSPGCLNCYSGTWQGRCLKSGGTGLPFDRRSRDLIEPFVDEKTLTQPLKWRGTKKIFVENQSDLFGEWYTDEMVDRVFAVMALCPQHTFQVLTKRPDRMLAWSGRFEAVMTAMRRMGVDVAAIRWPLPNVWLGVSVENQATANERIPVLLQTPAAKRFVSYEPALAGVDFVPFVLPRMRVYEPESEARHVVLDWVIVGGESGPGARPFDIQWARQTIQQCKAAGVACFVKQLGRFPVLPSSGLMYECRGSDWPEGTRFGSEMNPVGGRELKLKDRKGGSLEEWPEDLRVREMPHQGDAPC